MNLFVRKSIFFYIGIAFISMVFVLNMLFLTIYQTQKEKNKKDLQIRINKALKLYQNYSFYNITYKQFVNELKLLNFEYEQNLKNNKKGYIYIKNSLTPFVVKDLKNYNYNLWLYFLIDFILIMVVTFLIKNLLPLKIIVKYIKNMPNSQKLEIPHTFYEIEEIIKAINETNQKNISLNNSRKLFLRNIFHELLTPITKIKLSANMLENSKQKLRIENGVKRLEYVIKELKTIETLISKHIHLEKKFYSIDEILIKTFEISLSNIEVIKQVELELEVDIDYFSIALKNLVDNSLKYGQEQKIVIRQDEIIVSNYGKELKKDFENYIKPFNHSYENPNKGMGLGLYISNEILNLHNFQLKYKYENKKNFFIICLKSH